MPLNSVFSWFIKKRIQQMELFIREPIKVQRDLLRFLIEMGKYSAWGKEHGFKDIKSYEDFSSRIPLQNYEDLKPFIDRLQRGEQSVLWPSEIKWFAKSSGTTNDKSKYIPVSREALEDCHYKGGKDLLALYYHNNPEAKLYNGKSLVIGGSSQLNEFRDDSYIGDLSAIIIKNLPIWVELKRIPDKQIALMDRWEEKIEMMARHTMNERVTNITGVPSWTLVLLKRILELKGAKNIKEVWPDLELFMHGGVSFEPYRLQYADIVGSHINYYENYNASEGFFGVQDRNDARDMLLMLDYGIFYEFIPFEELDSPNPRVIDLSQVEVNKQYALVITTNSGLWRYQLGDTVRFTSISPYRIQVSGRTKHYINTFGEELMIHNAEKALSLTCSALGCSIVEYTAGPVFMTTSKQGGHEWLIEFEKEPENLETFSRLLDQHLKHLNSDYEAKRTGNLSLAPPIVRQMPNGTFYNWLKQKNKLGGQHKVPRLMNSRNLIEELMEIDRKNKIAI